MLNKNKNKKEKKHQVSKSRKQGLNQTEWGKWYKKEKLYLSSTLLGLINNEATTGPPIKIK